jgi:Protein of unknown function (DUF3800)
VIGKRTRAGALFFIADDSAMSNYSYTVFIDESGDEGFVFNPDGTGSSRWFVLSAIVVKRADDLGLVQMLKQVREHLRLPIKAALHFRELSHERRVAYVRTIGQTPLQVVSVLVHKPSILEPQIFRAEPHRLYRYAARLLVERISWSCRDWAGPAPAAPAELIFSNRDQMSFTALWEYLRLLRRRGNAHGVSIDWRWLDPECCRAVNHDQLAGLQVADAVASSCYYAANVGPYGETEDRYLRLLAPCLYRHNGQPVGYGLKFWPASLETLRPTNPHLETFAGL